MTNLNEELEMNEELDLDLDTDETTEKASKKKSLTEEKIVQINDNFRFIIHKENDFQLQVKKKYDDGTEDFVRYGWYGDIRSLAMGFINMNTIKEVRSEDIVDMKQLVKMYEESSKFMEGYIVDFKNHIKDLKKG